jgi:GTPase
MSKPVPRVVIVGRMNVGKSTLFNRLSESVKGITLDYQGVTRDFIKDTVAWRGVAFELIDTGGVSLRKTTDPLLHEVREKALKMLETADLLLFVCDGTVGLVPEDREIAQLIKKQKKNALVVVNKHDTLVSKEYQHEFYTLGQEQVFFVSAQHGMGIGELLDAIVAQLPAQASRAEDASEPRYKVVLLGKPNVGKSSLLNLLLKQDRAIVSDQPGTTREAISETCTFYKEDILLTDTPGVRRQRSVTQTLENLMVKSTFRAVERADIVLLLVDAHEGMIADQELKLAFYAFKSQHKALIILFNKQDLVDEYTKEKMAFDLEQYDFFFKKIVTLSISCKTGKNVGKIIPLVHEVWQRHSQQLSEELLTTLCTQALQKKPLYHKTNPLYVYKVYQVATAPITLLLTVNHPEWFEESQLGFFEAIVRKAYPLQGVPLKFLLRKKT